MALNSSVKIILPIALSIILPGLTIIVNKDRVFDNYYSMVFAWLFGGMTLYLMWYVIWFLYDKTTSNRTLKFTALGLGIALCVFGFNALNDHNNANDQPTLVAFRFVLAIILFWVIQYALRAQNNIANLRLEKEQIQTENYRVQLDALRNKIDPHFLFNSLNTLRSMVRQDHVNSEQFIMSLSDFYRKMLKYDRSTTLPLSDELEILESYLFLMKSRNQDAVSLSVEIDKELLSLELPILALQLVVENCFKHNNMTSVLPLEIKVFTVDKKYIVIQNNVQPKIGEKEDSGYGLDLLRKRYELLNVLEGLEVIANDRYFKVRLKLIGQ